MRVNKYLKLKKMSFEDKAFRFLSILLGILASTHFVTIGLLGVLFGVEPIIIAINLIVASSIIIYAASRCKAFEKKEIDNSVNKDKGFTIWFYGVVSLLIYCLVSSYSLGDFQERLRNTPKYKQIFLDHNRSGAVNAE